MVAFEGKEKRKRKVKVEDVKKFEVEIVKQLCMY